MFSNPVFIAFLGGMACLFVWMGITRPPKESFEEDVPHVGTYARIQNLLMTAGLTETSPMLVISSTIIAMTGIFILASLIANNVIIGIVLALLTPLGVWTWLSREKRKFNDRINKALVPFLRQMEANVMAQQNASQAFRYAVEKSPILRNTLQDKMNELRLNRPFLDVLKETKEIIPVRGWLQFVKAMEIQLESGGNLADTLKNAVNKINSRMLLQENVRGKYKTIAGQQKVILFAGIGIPIFFFIVSPTVFGNLFKTIIGIVGLIIGIIVILVGILISRNTVRDIEERIHY